MANQSSGRISSRLIEIRRNTTRNNSYPADDGDGDDNDELACNYREGLSSEKQTSSVRFFLIST